MRKALRIRVVPLREPIPGKMDTHFAVCPFCSVLSFIHPYVLRLHPDVRDFRIDRKCEHYLSPQGYDSAHTREVMYYETD